MLKTLLLTTALLLGMPAARAHGDAHPSSKPPTAAEQKPWGIAGSHKQVSRTVTLTMGDDMRFRPDRIEVREGDTLRLRIRNTGQLLHELVIGTPASLQAHAELMLKQPNMEHEDDDMSHVPPGKTGEIVWTFNRAGDFEFACLVAGHFQAGMRGTIHVRSR
jgi:uncharacterized cupredoxin-like copper-binding protein